MNGGARFRRAPRLSRVEPCAACLPEAGRGEGVRAPHRPVSVPGGGAGHSREESERMTDERTEEQAQGAAPAVEAGGATASPPPPAEPAAEPTPAPAPSAAASTPEPERAAAPVATAVPPRAPAPQPSPPEENGGMSMAYNDSFRPLTEGSVVTGTVVHIDREGVLVDVGTKSDGLIPPNELSREPGTNAQDVVKIGQKVDVY